MEDRTQLLIDEIKLAATQLEQGSLDAGGVLERLQAIQEDYRRETEE